jgi:hypothetical protein
MYLLIWHWMQEFANVNRNCKPTKGVNWISWIPSSLFEVQYSFINTCFCPFFFQFYRINFLYPVGLNLSVSGNRSLQYFSLFLFSFWKTAPCCNGLLSRHFRERSYLCLSLKMGISSFSKTSGNGPTHYTVLSSENEIICSVVIFSFWKRSLCTSVCYNTVCVLENLPWVQLSFCLWKCRGYCSYRLL